MDRSNLIRDGIKYLGLYLLLAFISIWVPVIGIISFLLLPIPMVFFTYKYELKAGITLAFISFFLLFIIIGPLALLHTLLFASSGVIIGELYRKKREAFAVLLGGALSFIIAIVLIYIGSIVVFNIDPIEEIQGVMIESTEMTESMMFLPAGEDEQAINQVYDFIDELSVIAPSLMIILGISLAFIVQVIASIFLRRANYQIGRFPPFREWGFPKAFIWYYLITYVIILIGVEQGTPMYTIIGNLTTVLEIVMVIQGFALVFFFFHKKSVNAVLPIILVAVSFLFPIFLHIVRILGIIDLGFDLRKRMNLQK